MREAAIEQTTVSYLEPGVSLYRTYLLTSSFRYAHRRVLFGQARLYGDRVELRGWTLRGRHRRCIPLAEVACLEYHTLHEDAALTFFLRSDRVVSVHLRQAQQWRVLFENWRRSNVFTRSRFYDGLQDVPALA